MKKTQLVQIALVVVTGCILLVLFYLPYWSVREKTIAAYDGEQLLLADKAIDEIRTFFTTYAKALTYLSTQPGIIRLDREGRSLMKNFLAIHASEISAVTRIDATGHILYTVPETDQVIGRDVSAQAHNRRMMQSHRPIISDVFRSVQGFDAIAFAYPVFEGENYAGAVSFLIPFARVAGESLRKVRLAPQSFILLISRNGIGLYCPQKKHIGRPVRQCFGGQPGIARLVERMRTGQRGSMTLRASLGGSDDAIIRHAVYAPIRLPADNYWSLVIISPESAVLGAMREFRTQWLSAVAAAVGVLVFLFLLLARTQARIRTEREQRQAEQLFVRLLDSTPMGVAVYNLEGELLYVNQSVLDLLGADPDQVIGHNIFEFLLPEYHRIARERIQRLLEGKKNPPAVIRLRTLTGEICDIEITTAFLEVAGQPRLLTVLRDVTRELKRRAVQLRLVTAIEQARESVVITDSEGVIEYVNPAFTRISGYSREEARGRKPSLLKSGRHDLAFYRDLWQTIKSGQVWQGRLINRKKNGELFWEMATISPVRDDSGAITHFVAVKRDITHEVELEDKLRQAQKMEAIGTLAGGIAHDFNNILGGIIGFADLALLRSSPDDPVYEALVNIRRGGKRAADLVQQILTFSRQSVTEKRPVPVQPLIRESLTLLRASLPSTISIHLDLEDETAHVMADAIQLQQVIINLCTNSFQAMRDRGGDLTIRLRIRPASGSGPRQTGELEKCLRLEVIDTGEGISPEVRARIFDPFFTTKNPGEGTGMGLSVVHGIIRDLGGEIQVDSTPGQGTTFTIVLPLVSPEQVNGDEEPVEELPRGRERVVVVDDEEDIQTTSRMMLEHLGYQVIVAGDPVRILEDIRAGRLACDLVITDQTMPAMTGLELARALKQFRADLPVILCTGFSDQVREDRLEEEGVDGLLMKPVELREMALAVRQTLDRYQRAPATGSPSS